jgi:2-dehydro-3-deoxyphosphooctonate aldolase (KDO 8-P synthase)
VTFSANPRAFTAGSVAIGSGELFLIAGPCVIESEAHARKMADAIQRICSDVKLPLIFKASYDKANRTSIHSYRGPGLTEGLRILSAIARDTGLPVLTDVHTAEDCAAVAQAVDVLQIPAFLCRQTDLLIAAAQAAAQQGRAVNIKKGQFVAPQDMRHAVEKVRDAWDAGESAGQQVSESGGSLKQSESVERARVFLTERGASFGYGNLVVDMRSLAILREYTPVVFDGTHSVQMPSALTSGGGDGVATSGGQPQFIPVLARAAVAAGVDGIFLEVHDNPARAKSDGANALRLDFLKPLLEELLELHAVRRKHSPSLRS